MAKLYALLQRRAGISRKDFIQYYENVHAPLIMTQAKPFATSYTRSYLDYDDPYTIIRDPAVLALMEKGQQPFDVITELAFHDRAALEAYFAAGRDQRISERKAEDEANFLNRDAMQVVMVSDVRTTPQQEFGQ